MNQPPATRQRWRPRAAPSFVTLLLSFGAATAVAAQFDAPDPDAPIYELRHLTGLRSIGWIAEERGDTVVFRSLEGGEFRVDRRTASLRQARGRVVGGEFWREDQNHSRLFFAPTGRPLHTGQAYAGVFLVLPFVGYGVTDDLTIAGGFNPFGGELASMDFWVAPKYQLLGGPERQISAGAFYLHLPGDPFFDEPFNPDPYHSAEPTGLRLGIGYGVATFGTIDRAVHVGAGVAQRFGSRSSTHALAMLGGEYRMSRRAKLISENWFITPEHPIIALGVRSVGDRWTWDYGLMALLFEEGAPYIPIISFSYAFGAGR
jgi:hypothetical protein